MVRHVRAGVLCAIILACHALLGGGVGHGQETFTPSAANDPATCSELWAAIGLPKYRPSAQVNKTLVCHTRYVLSHNNAKKTPDWVIERLTREQVGGNNTRPDIGFRQEKNVPRAARASDDDYVKSDFDRGHQAPSDDFNSNVELMEESFILSNAVPQEGEGFNQYIWPILEQSIRDLLENRAELYVITGPVYQDARGRTLKITKQENACGNAIDLAPLAKTEICEANNQNSRVKCDGAGVAVPAGLYKIIYDPQAKRVNAYIMPNIDHRGLRGTADTVGYINKFRTTLLIVEEFTGIQFLTAFPSRDRRRLNEQCQAVMIR